MVSWQHPICPEGVWRLSRCTLVVGSHKREPIMHFVEQQVFGWIQLAYSLSMISLEVYYIAVHPSKGETLQNFSFAFNFLLKFQQERVVHVILIPALV